MMSPIHHTFGPHVTVTYCISSIILFFNPWKWKKGIAVENLRNKLSKKFNGETALFSSGREALYAILVSFNIKNDDEVIIQGYTCSVVPNAIRATGAIPVYADIEKNSLNLSEESVRKKITSKTRAVICQHTFGIPADASALRALCNEHNLIFIEDCAHILPDIQGKNKIGELGDAIFFSFGRDKAISGITGGAAIIRKSENVDALLKQEKNATHLSYSIIGRLLLYPCIYGMLRPLYGIGIGKILLWLAGRIHLLVPYVTSKEKKGITSTKIHKIPNACAELVLSQIKNINLINNHRRKLIQYYLDEIKNRNWLYPKQIEGNMALQKFPIFTDNSEEIRQSLKKYNIHLEDGWTCAVVCPRTTDNISAGYESGDCPKAEELSCEILSLPTHPTMTMGQAKKLIEIIEEYMPRHVGK